MKKALLFTLAILTVLSMAFTLPASPAAAKGSEKSITLLSAQYIPGKGVTFKFTVQGDFADFDGLVMVNGQEFALNCALNDDGDLACTANQGLSSLVGEMASVTVNGYTASIKIRGASNLCYPVFDVAWDAVNNHWLPGTWEQAMTYCQDNSPSVGDSVNLFNHDEYYDYFYSLDGQDILANPPDMGPGYYWDYSVTPS